MSNRITTFQYNFEGLSDIVDLTKQWASILYNDQKFINKENGVDFFVDRDFNEIQTNDNIIVTKWGRSEDNPFYCVTGHALYDIIPHWTVMENVVLEQAGLTSWLDFPCLLISKGELRKHTDIGRPTTFNIGIFNESKITNYVTSTVDGVEVTEEYQYNDGEAVLLDVTKEHGSTPEEGEEFLRAMINMGFKEDYDTCKKRLSNILSTVE